MSPALSGDARNEVLSLKLPICSIRGALAAPAERIVHDLAEDPADLGFRFPSLTRPIKPRQAGRFLAFLHDILTVRAADLAKVNLVERIVPENVPGIKARIVDTQRCAVE